MCHQYKCHQNYYTLTHFFILNSLHDKQNVIIVCIIHLYKMMIITVNIKIIAVIIMLVNFVIRFKNYI